MNGEEKKRLKEQCGGGLYGLRAELTAVTVF